MTGRVSGCGARTPIMSGATISCRTAHNGTPFRILNIIDDYSRACLVVRVERRLFHQEVLEEMTWLFCARGLPFPTLR